MSQRFYRLRPLLLLPLLASCAAIENNSQGPLQPQSTNGPCEIRKFFLLDGSRSAPADMTVTNTGQTCSFVLINQALNVPLNAALLTGPAQHGRAEVGLISGGRQAEVRYTPAPGYAGPDKFAVTIQPNALGVTVNVTVKPAR